MIQKTQQRFTPVGNTMMVELVHDTKLSIVLPDGSDTKRETARVRVVALGKGRLLQSGEWSPIECKVGDYVKLVPTERALTVTVGGSEYLVVDADALVGVWGE